MKNLLYIAVMSIVIQSCVNKEIHNERPDAGTITYSIKYPEEIADLPTTSLMPKHMKFSFWQDHTRIGLKGSFNIFALDFYSPSTQDSCSTLFRFIDNKLIHTAPLASNFFFFDQDIKPSINLNYTETKEIEGLTCKKAQISYPKGDPFFVYYTQDIKLNNPNRHTPLADVPGVVLDFYVDYNDIRFHFSACKIDFETPEHKLFELPTDAKTSSKSEIEGMVLTLINNFQ